MVRLKCPKKDCRYEWDYGGESKFYATCPRCKTPVNIEKNRINPFRKTENEKK